MPLLTTAIVLAVLAVLVLLAGYNALADQKQAIRAAWAVMDAELKRRYVVLGRLVGAYDPASRPPELDAAIAAKNDAAVAFNPAQLAKAERELTRTLHGLVKPTDPRAGLVHKELVETETSIDKAVGRYNDRVDGFNAAVHSLPTSWIAKLAGFKPEPPFGVEST